MLERDQIDLAVLRAQMARDPFADKIVVGPDGLDCPHCWAGIHAESRAADLTRASTLTLSAVEEFDSPQHYEALLAAVTGAVAHGDLTEVPVTSRYASDMFEERWYLAADGTTWRLVAPDFPFKGIMRPL